MIAIENTLVSEDLLDKKFVCDLNACKGECCVAGDSGAPLEKEEIAILEKVFPVVKRFMPADGVSAVEEQGVFVIDEDGDYTTPLVEGKQCAFVYFENKIAKCAIEKAFNEGLIDYKKPVSCHLYPVRVTKYADFTAVNYHRWEICKDARTCGKKLGVPVYKFLKTPLIRKFGEDWFSELEKAAQVREKQAVKRK